MKRKYVKLSDQVRRVILDSGQSRYAISKATGIDAAVLCRFMAGKAGLSTPVLDTLGEHFGLRLGTDKPKGK
jgi:hypothetical protein